MKRRMLEVLILIAVALVPATALCQNAGANDEKVGKLPPCKDKEKVIPPKSTGVKSYRALAPAPAPAPPQKVEVEIKVVQVPAVPAAPAISVKTDKVEDLLGQSLTVQGQSLVVQRETRDASNKMVELLADANKLHGQQVGLLKQGNALQLQQSDLLKGIRTRLTIEDFLTGGVLAAQIVGDVKLNTIAKKATGESITMTQTASPAISQTSTSAPVQTVTQTAPAAPSVTVTTSASASQSQVAAPTQSQVAAPSQSQVAAPSQTQTAAPSQSQTQSQVAP